VKLINTLFIEKEKINLLFNSGIKIKKLQFINTYDNDIFYYDNLDFFIKNVFLDQIFYAAKHHDDKLNSKQKKQIKEIIINSNDPYNLFYYATDILKDRWLNDKSLPLSKRKEIESKIGSNNDLIYNYVKNAIKGRWEEYEDKIAESGYVAEYAKSILGKRWVDVKDIDPEIARKAEKNILTRDASLNNYISYLLDSRWKELEDNIDKINPYTINHYFNKVKERLPELEDYISKNKKLASFYVSSILKPVLNKSWNDMKGIISSKIIKQAEDSIYSDMLGAINYSIDISKERLPLEIENKILNGYEVTGALRYVKEMIKGRSRQFEKNLIKLKKEIDNDNLIEYLMATYPEHYHPGDYDNASTIYTLVAIYEYAKDIIRGPWPEVGINNNEDFKNLRRKIISLDELEFLSELREEEENNVELNY
jgi:hypothetical protein